MGVIDIDAIRTYFGTDGLKQFRKGLKSVDAKNVQRVTYDAELGTISGQVWASMKNQTYICMAFLKDRKVTRGTCTCPVGQVGKCHHIAALLFHAEANVSSTSFSCQWVAPKKVGKGNEGLAIEAVAVPVHTPGYRAFDECFEIESFDPFLKTLPQEGEAARSLQWLLSGEDCFEPDDFEVQNAGIVALVPDIETTIQSSGYSSAPCKSSYLKVALRVTFSVIQQVAAATLGQAKNCLWLKVRRHRITASNFGKVIRNIRSGRTFASVAAAISGTGPNIDHVKEIEHGRYHEKVAISQFEKQSGQKVEPTGLWLHHSGILGASPDGLIGKIFCVEVKCPLKYHKLNLQKVLKEDHSYIMYVDNEDIYRINKKHDYYDQIQGQLYLTNREACILIVWSDENLPLGICYVPKDLSWGKNIDEMINWYLTRYVPHVFGSM